jgi:ribonuclease D
VKHPYRREIERCA